VINTEEFYYKSADGLNLYCRVYASAQQQNPTVLCLPGLTRNSRDFAVLAAHLATRYRVLTPDLRGRGRSDHDPHWQNYHPGTYLADIWALLQAQPSGRIAVIGTSLGALLAMAMAAERPETVAGIVLNDAGPEIDPAGLARIAQYVGKQAPVNSWSEAVAYTRAVYGEALPGLSEEQWADAYAARLSRGWTRPASDRYGPHDRRSPARRRASHRPVAALPAAAAHADTGDTRRHVRYSQRRHGAAHGAGKTGSAAADHRQPRPCSATR
jgi:pimeloyl-ACP methyl ester carboxylesterase